MAASAPDPQTDLQHFTFEAKPPLRGTAILIHGHGDYSGRYDTILDPFLHHGITCLSTDLPGHGESPGRRGFIKDLHSIDQIIDANLARARSICPDGPIGLIGHSVGGLLALRELQRNPDRFDFSWISSPLLRPDTTRHPFLVFLLRIIASLFPNIPLDTGVTAADCRHFDSKEEEDAWTDGLFHSQISLGWGRALLFAAEEIAKDYPTLELPVLFTQGGADTVCKPEFLRQFLSKNSLPHATHLEFEDQRHEPFADSAQDEVFAAINSWLKQNLVPQESSPSG